MGKIISYGSGVLNVEASRVEDIKYLKKAEEQKLAKSLPSVGDFVNLSNGESKQITKIAEDGRFQLDKAGSFYLWADGAMNFSGSFDLDVHHIKTLKKVEDKLETPCWFFSVKEGAGGDKGVEVSCKVNVWSLELEV